MPAVPGGGSLIGPVPEGAVRRTHTITVAPHGRWASGQTVAALGRDLARGRNEQTRAVSDEFRFEIDPQGAIIPDPSRRSVPSELAGSSVRRGLRKRVAELRGRLQERGDDVLGAPGSIFDSMLDDTVGTVVASGYGRLYDDSVNIRTGDIVPGMRQVCVGFNTMHRRGEAFDVQRYLESKPPSVEFVPCDSLAWHDDCAAQPNTFRRRRMLQVAPDDDRGSLAVTGYFRDTYMRPDGVEMIVHEYGLNATVSGEPKAIETIEAVPGNLPMEHCPLAATSARGLLGVPLADVDATTRHDLRGPAGCTHLNDELRSLRLVPDLLAQRI